MHLPSLDWQFLQGFADQAAIAVRNARLVNLLETERTRLATILRKQRRRHHDLDCRPPGGGASTRRWQPWWGWPPEDAVGRPCGAVLPLDNVTGYHLCQDEAYSGQLPAEGARCEGELARPRQARLVLAVTYTPLYGEERSRLLNIIVNVHDITRFREEEEMKSTFTSIISHELKTPVALIKGYAQTLARPDATWDAETARQGLADHRGRGRSAGGVDQQPAGRQPDQASGLKLDCADVNLQALARKVADAYRTQTRAIASN